MMSLPSYQEAVNGPSVWALVARYLPSVDLVAACRASSEVYESCAPILWADPIEITATKKLPFTKTNAFIECVKQTRKSTRDLVLILDLRPLLRHQSPALSDFVKNENIMTAQWVLRRISFFKNLRFVVTDGLKMWDERPDMSPNPATRNETPQILLLSASSIYNMDSCFIPTYPPLQNVMYLDISYTTRPEHWTQCFSEINLPNLRVAKLCGLRLTDQNLPFCILATRCRLWSLDLRDNLLSDQAIERLLSSCFLSPITKATIVPPNNSDENLYDDSPIYQRIPLSSDDPGLTSDITCPLRPDDKDGFINDLKIRGHLTAPNHNILDNRDDLVRSTGLTHLYLANNNFTSLGITRLLHSTNRLQVLDIGSVRAFPSHEFNIPHTTAYAQPESDSPLRRLSWTRLEKLRIHHSVVTHVPTLIVRNGDPLSSGYNLQSLKQAETKIAPKQYTLWNSFNPLENYRLSSLTLTDIPTKSFGWTIGALITFLKQCARQEEVLNQAASTEPQSRRAPQLLKGVKLLRLEFLPESITTSSAPGASRASVSGDRDADEFHARSVGDFSFFDDPISNPSASNRGSSDSCTDGGASVDVGSSAALAATSADVRDVVEELKKWRLTEEGKTWSGKLEIAFPSGG